MSNPKKRALESESSDSNYIQAKDVFFEELSNQSLDELTKVKRQVKEYIRSFHRRIFEDIIREELKKNNFSLSFIIPQQTGETLSPENKVKSNKTNTHHSDDSNSDSNSTVSTDSEDTDNTDNTDSIDITGDTNLTTSSIDSITDAAVVAIDEVDEVNEKEEKEFYKVTQLSAQTELIGSFIGRKCYLNDSIVKIYSLGEETHTLVHWQFCEDRKKHPNFEKEIANEHRMCGSMDFDGGTYRGEGDLTFYIHYTKERTLKQAIQLSKQHPEEIYHYLCIEREGISAVKFKDGKYQKDIYKDQTWTDDTNDFDKELILVPTNEQAVNTEISSTSGDQ